MNCEQARIRLIEDLYDAELAQGWSDDVAEHLAKCEACEIESRQLRGTHQELAQVSDAESNRTRQAAAMCVGKVIERAGLDAERSSRRWRQIGVCAVAASVLIACLMLCGLRIDWAESGVQLAWGAEQPGVPAERENPSMAADQLVAQRAEIEELKASLAAMQQSLSTQQQTSQEIIAAAQQNFAAIQMQMERSDFRISVLKANVRDLGSILTRFGAALDSTIATNSTPGERP